MVIVEPCRGIDDSEFQLGIVQERIYRKRVWRTSTGIDLDVVDVFTKGKWVTIVLKGGPLEVQITVPGRISVQAIVE